MAILRNADILAYLYNLGHFNNPASPTGITLNDLPKLSLASPEVIAAVKSFQAFMLPTFEAIYAREKGHTQPVIDGDVGPLTLQLLQAPRCGHPDYTIEGAHSVAPATGSGSWAAGCNKDHPEVHYITVRFNKSHMPRFLEPVFESEVWPVVQACYADIGLWMERVETRANIEASFEPLSGSTIGLAIVPGGPQSCGNSIWAKFDPGYEPGDIINQWRRLLAHEHGHNQRLQHTVGGIMNPGITSGAFSRTAWRGDPSEGILARYYGGKPVSLGQPEPPPPPPPRGDLWLDGTLRIRRGEEIVETYNVIRQRAA